MSIYTKCKTFKSKCFCVSAPKPCYNNVASDKWYLKLNPKWGNIAGMRICVWTWISCSVFSVLEVSESASIEVDR